MILDADLTVPPEDLPRFFDALKGALSLESFDPCRLLEKRAGVNLSQKAALTIGTPWREKGITGPGGEDITISGWLRFTGS